MCLKIAQFLGKAAAWGAAESLLMKAVPAFTQPQSSACSAPSCDARSQVLGSSSTLHVRFWDGISGNFPSIVGWFGLEGILQIILFQRPPPWAGTPSTSPGCPVQPGLEHFQGGAAAASLGNLGQCLTTLMVKNFFVISGLNLPSFSLKPLPLVLSLHALFKSPSPAFFWVLEGCPKVSLEPSLLQAEQPQISQPVFIREVLQPSDHLRGPVLDSLQFGQTEVIVWSGRLGVFVNSPLSSCLEESICSKSVFSAASPRESSRAASKVSVVFYMFWQVASLINVATDRWECAMKIEKKMLSQIKSSALEGSPSVCYPGDRHNKAISNDAYSLYSVCRNIWSQIWHWVVHVQIIVPGLTCVPERLFGGTHGLWLLLHFVFQSITLF